VKKAPLSGGAFETGRHLIDARPFLLPRPAQSHAVSVTSNDAQPQRFR
jgi:hypothetical protein